MLRSVTLVAALVFSLALAAPPTSAAVGSPHVALRDTADAFAAAPDAARPLLLARAAGYAVPAAPVVPALAFPDALVALEHAADAADGRAPSLARDARLFSAASRVNADLAAPLARIAGAEAAAIPLVVDALSSVTPSERAAFLAGSTFAPPTALVTAGGSTVFGAASADPAPLAPRVNVGELAVAESLVLGAIEVSLPALKAASVDSGPSPIVEAPYIAVDNTPATIWTVDYYLMVDLQGDDTYLNHAGASTPGMMASVLVDVQGNDQYLASGDVDAISVQGVGSTGLGILVDGGGNDVYSVDATRVVPDLTPAKNVKVYAQGVGVLGAGALVDLGGHDTFRATDYTRGGTATVAAQGAGSLGIGLIVDRGDPGIGAGVFPVAVGIPAGPSILATATSDLLLVYASPTQHIWSIGSSGVVAQGAASTGAGGLVGSAGDDHDVATSSSGSSTLVAQGAADTGAGLVADLAGANTYTARALGDVELRLDVPVVCPQYYVCGEGVTVNTNVGSSSAIVQGAAQAGAGALVASGLGPDVFDAATLTRTLAEAGVSFAGGGGSAGAFSATASSVGGSSALEAQGAAATGAALLVGSAGNDVYATRSNSVSQAYANSTGGSSNAVSATASGGASTLTSQADAAVGVAALIDPAGNDAYSANSATQTIARQNGLVGSQTPSVATFTGQAHAKTGFALFADLGGSDTYSSSPAGSAAGDGKCWTNSPPSIPASANTDIAIGIDAGGGVPASCEPVPPN
ncbi:MAG: hypothetical protein ACYDCK_08165 [Thermoplasmatota archaeon]